ncbi:hypothetical protein FF125_16305 [Aureibaculum algae]|uniref:Uncharacterized protein n=1 Tax=Aureibaculum algae TaxID=2584122 RepID=A0A5B7TX33_9FLAO|nr:cytochrome c [Aureibaculum algae]QCX39923.1 hypothetical protein FF125_16305 [Aureibaculum algae]
MMKNLIFISIFILTFTSCTSKDDDPIDEPINNITYTTNIKNLIDNKCNSCHSNPQKNGAPMALVTLVNVKDAVLNKDLIGRVEDGSMPPEGDVLTSEQIELIKDWEKNSFK